MRLRLILSFCLIILVSVVSVVLITRRSAITEIHTFMFRGGMSGNQDLVKDLEDYYRTHQNWEGVDTQINSPGPGQGQRQGNPGGNHGMGGMMNQELILADAHGDIVVDSGNLIPSGNLNDDDLARAIQLMDNGQVVGYLVPEDRISFSQTDEANLIDRLNRAALMAGLIAGGLSILLTLLLAYSLIRPVRTLTTATEKLAAGNLDQRVIVSGKDELAALGQAFNRMADSLQSAEETRQAMTADIAHELRNPLAVQRASLEALIDEVYPLTIKNLTPIMEQNQLLARLVEDLRTLALADADELRLERSPTKFSDLVRRVVERFDAQADARLIRIEIRSDDSLPMISLDAGRVEQILGNLISNALRYAPDGSPIILELSSTTSAVQLSVHDNGPGIPEESLAHIFDRFYRVDRSRSRSEGGTGLGLAIARKLTEAHRGKLTARNHPNGGAEFILTLPHDWKT